MKIPGYLRMLLLGLASMAALISQVDAREIIRNAVAADDRNWRIARNYAFLQRVELRRLDSQGKVRSSEVQTYDITLQEGTPYRQLVQRDDRPLPATEQRREQESFARSIAQRRQESTAERARRLSAYEGRWPEEMLGRTRFPSIGELPYLLTLAPRGWFWFLLKEEPAGEEGRDDGGR